jgi:hypothetical protein
MLKIRLGEYCLEISGNGKFFRPPGLLRPPDPVLPDAWRRGLPGLWRGCLVGYMAGRLAGCLAARTGKCHQHDSCIAFFGELRRFPVGRLYFPISFSAQKCSYFCAEKGKARQDIATKYEAFQAVRRKSAFAAAARSKLQGTGAWRS